MPLLYGGNISLRKKECMDTKKVINYSDIFFSCSCNDKTAYSRMFSDHLLVYVYSGELILEKENVKTVISKGGCVFICREHRVKVFKQLSEDEQFQVIILVFRRKNLWELYHKMDKPSIFPKIGKVAINMFKIPPRPDITSLFLSLTPYFDTCIQPSVEIVNMKIQEGIFILLKTNNRFSPLLFDFTEPWKIDILSFLNENYMHDLSIKEISARTGRSLATFKRDFKKISDLPPRKWIIQKRLEAAYDQLSEKGMKVGDVYIAVGFKNLSHFYLAFKRKYGFSPGNRDLK